MSRARSKPTWPPWYPRYVDDYNNDDKVLGMDWAERGFFDFLLDLQWREGSITADRRGLARLARMTVEQFELAFGLMVDTCFAPVTDDAARLQNSKLERVRADQEVGYAAQRERANKRYCRGSAGAVPGESRGSPAALPYQIPDPRSQKEQEKKPEEAPAQAQAPKVRARKLSQPKATRPGWSELIATYHDEWKALHSAEGKGPSIEGADTSALARVYDAEGLDEARTLVRRFVSDPDPFIARRGHILRDLPVRINAYRAKPPNSAGRNVSSFADSEHGADEAHKLRQTK